MPNRHSKPLTTFSSSFAQTLRRENLEIVRYRFASRLGQGIGEAIPEIQTCRMSAPIAEVTVGFAGNPRPGPGNRRTGGRSVCLKIFVLEQYRFAKQFDEGIVVHTYLVLRGSRFS